MIHDLKNVPELRFPEFKSGWKKDKLGTLIENNTILNQSDGNHGSLYPRNSEFINSGIPYISASNIKNNEIDFSNVKYLEMERAKQFKKGVAQNEDVLLAHNATVGPTALLKTDYPFVILSTTLTLYRLNKDKVNNYYFLYSLQSKNIQNQLTKLMKQTTRNQVPILLQRTMILTYPRDLEEQEKIGNFFSKLDRQIELEEKKLELLEQQKRGYMQKIFSQELRFKDDKGINYPEWRYNYLGDYLILHDEKTTENNQYPVLTSSREGLFLQKDYFTRDVASKDNTGYNVVPYGYFTYRHMSDDLIFKFNINYIVQKGIVSTLYPVFKTTNDLDNYFLKEILNSGNEFKKYALMQKQGGSRTYMYFSKLKKLKLHIPVLEEQQKIGDFFSKLDSSIEKQSAKVELLKKRKQAFLQKMFV
ncbi:hypothetical protein B2G94_05850 [Staphylococcus hominis subsp. hominis]|uniref:restriction endonuclease subunit S n=1 Tax=Staphylococcus hominis TaxID=1290 RepID=UPI000B3B3D3D|nr:restriction endonuclease subunit S [Staphylococcus hominis]AUJ52234.1 hypothetical protein B7P03_06200 [Staphylococcus hominis subsp. hominis]OUL46330.1 hypothetical protein B2G94_05850 [Staphylococcus hominis subsp. hominis]